MIFTGCVEYRIILHSFSDYLAYAHSNPLLCYGLVTGAMYGKWFVSGTALFPDASLQVRRCGCSVPGGAGQAAQCRCGEEQTERHFGTPVDESFWSLIQC